MEKKYHKILFLSLFFENFFFFFFEIFTKTLSSKEIDICTYREEYYEHNLPEIIEYNLVVIDELYPEKYDRERPDNRSDHIIEPEIFLLHSTRSRDKRDDCTSEIMKFSEYNIPKSISLYLTLENFCLGTTDSEPVTIAMDEFISPPFSYPVSDVVPDHRSENCSESGESEMSRPPESSYEYHDIHPWYSCPDEGQTLDTC
jgi:hypothetical protein